MVVDGIKRGRSIRVNRTRLSVEANKAVFALVVTLGIIILTLAISFLFLNNESAQKAYRLSQVQEQNNELQNAKQGIDAKLVEVLSANTIEDTRKVQKMTEPETKTFLKKPKR